MKENENMLPHRDNDLQNTKNAIANTKEESSDKRETSLKERLQKDQEFRRNFGVWLCLCLSFHVLGWNLGIGGPTLLDLKMISSSSLEEASLFVTAMSAGYLVASFVISVTFDRFDKYLHIALGNLGTAVVMAAIPWCFVYGVMFTMHFLKGFTCGISELAASTLLIHLMGQNVKTYMQILHFSYTIGGIMSPLLAAPFLTTFNETDDRVNSSLAFNLKHSVNMSENITDIQQNSQVYIPYAVLGGLTLLPVLPFLLMFLKCNKERKSATKNDEKEKQEEPPPRLLISVMITLLMLWFVAFSIEDSIASFLATYAVKHFGWTTKLASYATSVFWTSFALGSFSGIFIASYFSVSRLLLLYSTIVLLSSISLLVTSIYNIDAGLWAFSGTTGACLSLNFPLLFTWVEEDFMHVTAKISAAFTVSASVGVIVSPIVVGVLMEMKPVYYSYFITANSVCFVLLLCVGKCLSLKTKMYRKKNEVELVINQNGDNHDFEAVPLKSSDENNM